MPEFIVNTVDDLHAGRHSWRVLVLVNGASLAIAVAATFVMQVF
ncbi:MAG TPA: hypothetical protein VFN10_10390 [Thermoanaerobaculia bacterium]|nr:hypothetical protein [Thermoanaerobaculia bacterium]